jgi:pectin methylesterase-like acyl-CoA thioesterase
MEITMKKIALAIVVGLLLSACVGTFVPIQTAETTGVGAIKAATVIPVVSADEASKLTSLGEVSGYSCKNKLWDADATEEAATHQVKLSAVQRNAKAVTGLVCTPGGTSLATNCWQSVKCTATALQ